MSAFISAIVPVHNEEKLLGRTLDSLLAQAYPAERIEIIAALNGCTDGSAAIAGRCGVRVVDSPLSGMSFGKNLGAAAARGGILVFVDADTTLPPDALRHIAAAMAAHGMAVLSIPGRPAKGGLIVRAGFAIANAYARRRQVLSPGPVLAVHRQAYDAVKGFDESLPQGTSSDFIMRVREAGGTYLFLGETHATTSIRRFEKHGILWQLLAWRRNHQDLIGRRRDRIKGRKYDTIR